METATVARRGEPCAIVVFGAAGDLTKRKLIPALYNLKRQDLLPDEFHVVGSARTEWSTEEFQRRMREDVRKLSDESIDDEAWGWLESRLSYVGGEFLDGATYERLAEHLADVERDDATAGRVIFYLATAPEFFAPIVQQLHARGLTSELDGRWRRVIVEKPFGRDLSSAQKLNADLREVIDERQIYRIDHYLGKETVQNLLVLRFANAIFEPIWNSRYVDHVQITVAETLGVEQRGGYYDGAGALRDMVPNHMFQLVSLVAMEPPISFDADAVRDEQAKVVRAIQPLTPQDVLRSVVRGQYAAGQIDGQPLSDYRSEPGVDPRSNTETFAAMKLGIDNWRWNGVPFYLRVGKALRRRVTEIVIQFKRAPFVLFRGTTVPELPTNRLVINVQPEEGIWMSFGAKVPGAVLRLGTVDMNFCYRRRFGTQPATGYERLLYDAMLGDQTLFQRTDMLDASWRVVDEVLDIWKALPAREFPNYGAGSVGPQAADELLGHDGRSWHELTP